MNVFRNNRSIIQIHFDKSYIAPILHILTLIASQKRQAVIDTLFNPRMNFI